MTAVMVNPSSALHDASPAFQLKGGSFTGTVLELHSTDLEQVAAQLKARLNDAAAWLQEAPVILNVEKVANAPVDWPTLVTLLRAHSVSLVAIRAPQSLHASLAALDVPVLQGLKRKGAEVEVAAPAVTVAAVAPAPRAATRIVTQPVRGGQQIYAEGDLIVLAPVSAGAEVLADGNIHIYAPLRGRALAGVQGNSEARIFCQSLEAELVSVAGRYRVAEDLRKTPQWGKAIQVLLDQDQLNLLDL